MDVKLKTFCNGCFFHFQVAEMVLELCVTELEDVATDTESGRSTAQPIVQESLHPYTDDTSQLGHVKIPGQLINFVLCNSLLLHVYLTLSC